MDKRLVADAWGWGFALWLFGYLLGFVFYGLVAPEAIGWWVMPIGLAATLFSLWRWVDVSSPRRALVVALVWTAIAVAFDYAFIVKLLHPADGYYKLDVYLYYASCVVLPLAASALRARNRAARAAN